MGLSAATASGITAVTMAFCFSLVACIFIFCRQRLRWKRNDRVNSSLDSRYGSKTITNPVYGAYSAFRAPSPPSSIECQKSTLIKVPPPIRTGPPHDKIKPRKYDKQCIQKFEQSQERFASSLGFKIRDSTPGLELSDISTNSTLEHPDLPLKSAASVMTEFSFLASPTPIQVRRVSYSSSSSSETPPPTSHITSGAGLPSHPKRNPSFTKAGCRNFSRHHVRDLSVSRGETLPGPSVTTEMVHISGPIVDIGARYEDDSEESRRGREREKLYRNGSVKREREPCGRESFSSRKSLY